LYVGWPNNAKGYTITSSRASGHIQPQSITPSDILIVTLDAPAPEWAKVSFSFSRPINALPIISSSSNYIWASSNDPPQRSDDPNSPYSFVTFHITLALNERLYFGN
jgi:hypothetical protein